MNRLQTFDPATLLGDRLGLSLYVLGHVFAQAADVERTIIAFWRMRISIEAGGDR